MSSQSFFPECFAAKEVGRAGRYLSEVQQQSLELALQGQLAPEYRQRIEIMLLTNAGRTQAQICRQVGCSPLTARHWMLMAKTAQAHLWQEQPIGRPKVVSDAYIKRLQEVAQSSPQQFGYSFLRWTGAWLSKHLEAEMGLKISARHINRLLKEADKETLKTLGSNRAEPTPLNLDERYPKLSAS
jgi:transposase